MKRKWKITRTTREKLSITQENFAAMLGISQSLLSMYEQHERSLPMEASLRLARLEIAYHRIQQLPAIQQATAIVHPRTGKQLEKINQELRFRVAECSHKKYILQNKLDKMISAFQGALLLIRVFDEIKLVDLPIVKNSMDDAWESFEKTRAMLTLERCSELAQARLQAKIEVLDAEAAVYERMAGRLKKDL